MVAIKIVVIDFNLLRYNHSHSQKGAAYAYRQDHIFSGNGFSPTARIPQMCQALSKEGIEVDWIELRNVIFEELNFKNDLKLDELVIRVLNRMAGKKYKKKEESLPKGYKYRVFIPPENFFFAYEFSLRQLGGGD